MKKKKKGAKHKVILANRVFIPIKMIEDVPQAVEEYTYREYDNAVCAQCDFRTQRHCDACESCGSGGFLAGYSLSQFEDIDGEEYLGLPFGDQSRIEKRLGIDLSDVKFKDMTSAVKFDYPVEFTGDLRDYQEEPVATLVDLQYGLLQSKPRTGKTVMAIAAAVRAGYRAVILADQKDFLDGFYETLESMTNLLELEEQAGKKLFGFPKTYKDYETFQVCLVTYQSLIADSKTARDRMAIINQNYGSVIVDEVHRANATCFARVLGALRMTMRLGLTATVKRKDGRQYLIRNLLGPVVATTDAEALTPTVVVCKSPPSKSRGRFDGKAGFTRLLKALHADKKRHALILDWVKRDLNIGRSIVIPVYFKDQVHQLVRDINAMMRRPVAAAFVGGPKAKKDRKDIVDAARAGEIRVVVGIRRLLQLGLNVPQWDTLYYVAPMNNAPNWEQESCRICTPMDNKKTPIIRMFYDEGYATTISCFRNTYKHSQALNYKTSEKSKRKLTRWLGIMDRKESMRDVPDFFEPCDGDFNKKKRAPDKDVMRSL